MYTTHGSDFFLSSAKFFHADNDVDTYIQKAKFSTIIICNEVAMKWLTNLCVDFQHYSCIF